MELSIITSHTMPGVFTLKAASALSGLSGGFALCVFNLFYYFLNAATEKKDNSETKPNKTLELSQ